MGNMLYYAIVFLVVALVAAFLGFGGVAGTAMEGGAPSVLGRDHPVRRLADCRYYPESLTTMISAPARLGSERPVSRHARPAVGLREKATIMADLTPAQQKTRIILIAAALLLPSLSLLPLGGLFLYQNGWLLYWPLRHSQWPCRVSWPSAPGCPRASDGWLSWKQPTNACAEKAISRFRIAPGATFAPSRRRSIRRH